MITNHTPGDNTWWNRLMEKERLRREKGPVPFSWKAAVLIGLLAACMVGFMFMALHLSPQIPPPQDPEQSTADSILIDHSQPYDSIHLGTVTWQTSECQLDTIPGTLLWHGSEDHNNGDAWGHGYWVGLCGPIGMPVDSFTFIPGIVRRTIGECQDSACEHVTYSEDVRLQEGTFYSSRWKKVPAERVYGFIVLRQFEKDTSAAVMARRRGGR